MIDQASVNDRRIRWNVEGREGWRNGVKVSFGQVLKSCNLAVWTKPRLLLLLLIVDAEANVNWKLKVSKELSSLPFTRG